MGGIRELFTFGRPFSSNGKAVVATNGKKALSFIGDERRITYLLGGFPADYDPDLGRDVRGRQAYMVAALAYICTRYRATKVREAPLMVVEESEEGEEWIEGHELDALLSRPNPDYGMRRLIEATETFLCLTGSCLWVKNRDRTGRVASLYPFSKDEFGVESANGKLYGRFRVNNQWVAPEDVCYFSYFSPLDPLSAVAPLDAALQHLNIGQSLAARVRNHVRNAMMPGGIYVADKEWRATDVEFQRLKDELGTMFAGVNSGKTAIAEGGGKIEKGWSLSDLALGELWREVEATVCGCFNVPPSLVGTVIGLENSPWSHLETAKRSFYDETILPEWELLEEVLTESLLRERDEDTAHLVRFDTSRIRALQKDVGAAAVVASTAQRWTSVNERRVMMGLPKSDDPKADEIPELTAPPPPKPGAPDAAAGKQLLERKAFDSLRFAYTDAIATEHKGTWEHVAAGQLERDADELADIVERELGKEKESLPTFTERAIRRTLLALEAYLSGAAIKAWAKRMNPLLRQTAEAALVATVVPDTGIDAQLLRPNLESFIRRESAFLITSVTDTTKEAVRTALAEGIEAGEGVAQIAKRIRELTTFDRARATLIARTETTRTLNGAPLEALKQYATTTGRRFTKRWIATLDDRVRDEHKAMHNETVSLDEKFSNGLDAPSEPNCRCGLTYAVEGLE